MFCQTMMEVTTLNYELSETDRPFRDDAMIPSSQMKSCSGKPMYWMRETPLSSKYNQCIRCVRPLCLVSTTSVLDAWDPFV